MGGTAASCLWLQPACHYDDSVVYQCRHQIYLSGTRLWPRLGLSLAPVHPSASKVLLWIRGCNLYSFFFMSATEKLFGSRGLLWDRLLPSPTHSHGAERKFATAGSLEQWGLNVGTVVLYPSDFLFPHL